MSVLLLFFRMASKSYRHHGTARSECGMLNCSRRERNGWVTVADRFRFLWILRLGPWSEEGASFLVSTSIPTYKEYSCHRTVLGHRLFKFCPWGWMGEVPRAVVVNYSVDIHSNLPSQYTKFIFLFMRPLLGAFHTSIGREFRITPWLPQRTPNQSVIFNRHGCLTWIDLASSLILNSFFRMHTQFQRYIKESTLTITSLVYPCRRIIHFPESLRRLQYRVFENQI